MAGGRGRGVTPADFRPIVAAGRRGWYAAAGTGPAVVLLASPLARGKTYLATADRLVRDHRVYVVEPPGCGRGDRLPRPWAVGDYAAWTAALLDTLSIESAAVVGHSYSGAVVVVLAADHPARVGRIVVVDSIGAGTPHPLVPTFFKGLYDLWLEAPLVLRAWHHVVGTGIAHPRNFFALARESLTSDVTAAAARVRVPALLAWGRRDHTFPPRDAAAYAAHLPTAETYISPGGSHDWIISRADEFAAVFGRFIRRKM